VTAPNVTALAAAITTPNGDHRGQVRVAYRLAEAQRGRLLHVHGVGWHRWDGKRWAADEDGEPTRAVLKALRDALAESLHDPDLRVDVRKNAKAPRACGVSSR
jgi:putative DNA primase/helicase